MKNGMLKNIQCADALNRIASTGVESFETRLGELRYLGGERFETGYEELEFSDHARATLCAQLKIPGNLLQRLGKGLGCLVLRCLVHSDPKIKTQRLRVVHNTRGVALSLASPELATPTNQEVVAAIRDAWPDDISSETLSVSELNITDAEFELSCHTNRLTAEPQPGDILHGGIAIRHSQAGTAPTVVLSYIRRLVCSNGLTQRVCLHGRPSRTKRCRAENSPERALDAIKRQIAGAWDQLQHRLDGFGELLEHRFEVDALPEALRRRWSINRQVGEEIAQALQNDELGRTLTEYDVVNALSRVATHSTRLRPRYRHHLSLAAGMFAQRHIHQCPTCGSWIDRSPAQGNSALPLTTADSAA